MIAKANMEGPLHTIYRPFFGKNIVYKPVREGQAEDVFKIGNVRYVLTVATPNASEVELWFLPGSQDPVFLVSVEENMTFRWSVDHDDTMSDRPCAELDKAAVTFFGLAPFCP